MPGIVSSILICAAVDGLLLHPAGTRHRDQSSLKIPYGSTKIISAARGDDNGAQDRSLEAHGIVGVLDLVSTAYLISITRRDQVAQIRGKPIYAVKDVTLIPLSSQGEAEKVLSKARSALKIGAGGAALSTDETEESDVGEEIERSSVEEPDPPADPAAPDASTPTPGVVQKGTSVVKNIIQDRGKYGRFAARWLTGNGSKVTARRQQGTLSDEDLTKEQKEQEKDAMGASTEAKETEANAVTDETQAQSSSDPPQRASRASAIETLTPRVLRSARLYFSSSGFFFSYEYDLSKRLVQQDVASPSLPLWKRFDSLFFWNQHLLQPFISTGQEGFILPLMQGFVGQRAFSMARSESGTQPDSVVEAASVAEDVVAAQNTTSPPETMDRSNQQDFLLTLISRRSVKRAGLRYLRRGIDNEGNVANNVESEQILSPQSWDVSAKSFSLVQVRGSIPLFFSQSPYSFKPLPILFGSQNTNLTTMQMHFSALRQRYGDIQIASLVDKHGTELGIGEAYQKHVKLLNTQAGMQGNAIGFEWFDFHRQCAGMKFENVSILLNALDQPLNRFGWLTKQDDRILRSQTGALRTNCMDCLDRTNVVQSAVGGWALQQQLAELGLKIDLQSDPKTQWFNTLWADNGDAISRQYAGTSALKGDFTRTRKRNWMGSLSDFSLTLNRYYNNIFGDYFLQLNIDYFLGNVAPSAFDEFEADMMSQDYALDVKRIRQGAIETCIKIVLEDPKGEDLVGGWTMSCPHEANTLRSLPFEECVLLLTDAALYFCRFDWDAEKVGSFERVDLADITELWRGAYVTSTLGPTHTDEAKNTGFALRYRTNGRAFVRTNTRSLNNEKAAADENEGKDELEKQKEPEKSESRLLAFKALPPKASAVKEGRSSTGASDGQLSEPELVKSICDDIHRLMVPAIQKDRGVDHLEPDQVPQVQEKDVISVAEARKSTGYIESLGYSLKKLVWS